MTRSEAVRSKETVDEIIFRTTYIRNRIMLELMARGGMRISEVLNLTASDVEDRKLIIRDAKSGKAIEHVFIPQKIVQKCIWPEGANPANFAHDLIEAFVSES